MKDNRDKKNDTKKSTNKKELITDYFSQMNDSKNNAGIQNMSLKGKQFITDYFKPINSKSSDQEPKQTVKEMCDLEGRIKKLEDENFKIKSKLEDMSRLNEALRKQLIKSKTTTETAAKGKPELKSKDTNRSTPLLGQPDNSTQQTGNVGKKPSIIVAGDSMVKGLNGWMMSRKNNVKVHSFSGATTEDMTDFLKPLFKKKPAHLIIHAGTNDLAYDEPEEIAKNIVALTKLAEQEGIKCAVSNIVKRDDHHLWNKAQRVNCLLNKSEISIIDNSNITLNHLNRSALHLNKRGDGALILNIISFIKGLDCKC